MDSPLPELEDPIADGCDDATLSGSGLASGASYCRSAIAVCTLRDF
jgi:hypothetical protein